jgi:hypothetical protein
MKLVLALVITFTLAAPMIANGDDFRTAQINGVWYKVSENAKAGVDFTRPAERPWEIQVNPGSKNIVPLHDLLVSSATLGQVSSPDLLGVFNGSGSRKPAASSYALVPSSFEVDSPSSASAQ